MPGRGQLTAQTINLAKLVEGMIGVLEVSITDKADIEFVGRDQPVFIKGDYAQVHQAILNVVSNAAEAIGDQLGRITLAIGTTHCTRDAFQPPFRDDGLPEGEYAYLEVSDTGCGMAPDTHTRAFDPFFTTKFTGRGAGAVRRSGHREGSPRRSLDSEPGRAREHR